MILYGKSVRACFAASVFIERAAPAQAPLQPPFCLAKASGAITNNPVAFWMRGGTPEQMIRCFRYAADQRVAPNPV